MLAECMYNAGVYLHFPTGRGRALGITCPEVHVEEVGRV